MMPSDPRSPGARPVDLELIDRYLLREASPAEVAEVEGLVATDPSWAAAVRRQAEVELALMGAVDELVARAVPAEAAPRGWWARLLHAIAGPGGVALVVVTAAALLFAPIRVAPDGAPGDVRWTVDPVLGEVADRSEGAAAGLPPVFGAGSLMSVTLRPASRLPRGAAPAVEVLLDDAPLGGAKIEVAPEGAVSVKLTFGDGVPAPAPGPHTLTIWIGGAPHAVPFVFRAP